MDRRAHRGPQALGVAMFEIAAPGDATPIKRANEALLAAVGRCRDRIGGLLDGTEVSLDLVVGLTAAEFRAMLAAHRANIDAFELAGCTGQAMDAYRTSLALVRTLAAQFDASTWHLRSPRD